MLNFEREKSKICSSSGHLTPDLNDEGRFLRGGLEEEMLNLEVGIKISSFHTNPVQMMMLNLEVGTMISSFHINPCANDDAQLGGWHQAKAHKYKPFCK